MKIDLNLQIALYGLIILLGGLVFLALDSTKYNLFVVTLTGVGGSVLATGLSNWLITKHYVGVDVTSIVQALTSNSKFIRKDQNLEIGFMLNSNNEVVINGEHRFTLCNQGARRSKKSFELYTDLGSWNNSGGFKAVIEPSGTVLQNKSLETFLHEENGKIYFKNSYDINSMSTASFLFKTFGNYRRVDRLIWTVQDISTDFSVRIVNNTGIKKAFVIKVNHHKEKEILKRVKIINDTGDSQEVIIIDFNCEVLPYQGFEIMWNLDKVPQISSEKGKIKKNLPPMHG